MMMMMTTSSNIVNIGDVSCSGPPLVPVSIADIHSTVHQLKHNNDVINGRRRLRARRNHVATATGCRHDKACVTDDSELRRSAVTTSLDESQSSGETTSGLTSAKTSPCLRDDSVADGKRLLMRSWLMLKADDERMDKNKISWHDDQHTQIRILWKHGSKSSWTVEDSRLFQEWAEYTGRCHGLTNVGPAKCKKWKANFRCALNSLSDVTEVKSQSQPSGNNPYRVFQIKDQIKNFNIEEINSTKAAAAVNKQKRPRMFRHAAKSSQSTRALDEETAASPQRRQPKRRISGNGRQESHDHNDVINVSAETLPLPVVECLTRNPLIPTVVEEMDSDAEWKDEKSSLRGDLQVDEHASTCIEPSSPGSSGYITDSYNYGDSYFDLETNFEPSAFTYVTAAELDVEETLGFHNLLNPDEDEFAMLPAQFQFSIENEVIINRNI